MRQVWPAIVLALGACRSARAPGLTADAAADASAALDASIDGTIDGAIDGTIDGAIDGMPDAALPDAPVDGCPHRTAPPGQPDKTYAPNEIHLGDVTIRSQVDLDALAGIKYIGGNLTIEGSFTVVTLPDLEVVEDGIDVIEQDVTELHMPLLETAGGLQTYQAPVYGALDLVDLPRLESVVGGVAVRTHQVSLPCYAQGGLTVRDLDTDPLSLPKLTQASGVTVQGGTFKTLDLSSTVAGTVTITSSSLQTIKLASATAFADTDDAALTELHLGTTGPMQYITIRNAASQGPLVFDVAHVTDLASLDLESVSGLTSIASLASTPVHAIWLTNAPLLTDLTPLQPTPTLTDFALYGLGATTMRFPSVVTVDGGASGSGELLIESNLSLTTLDLPNLTTLGYSDSYIAWNPMLPNCQATAIAAHVTLKPSHTLDIEGNGSGSCP